jgi:hypothetical protein
VADGGRSLSLRYDRACVQRPVGIRSRATGAEGEGRLRRILDDVASENVRILHDRRIPSSPVNIDHLAVTPEGVFVIDAQDHRGPVGLRDTGPAPRARPTLYVDGRPRTELVDGMWPRVDAVRDVVGPNVTIHPALCFVDVEWLTWSKHFELDRVLVTAWEPLRRRLTRSRRQTDEVDVVAAQLEGRLEPATAREARVGPPG